MDALAMDLGKNFKAIIARWHVSASKEISKIVSKIGFSLSNQTDNLGFHFSFPRLCYSKLLDTFHLLMSEMSTAFCKSNISINDFESEKSWKIYGIADTTIFLELFFVSRILSLRSFLEPGLGLNRFVMFIITSLNFWKTQNLSFNSFMNIHFYYA